MSHDSQERSGKEPAGAVKIAATPTFGARLKAIMWEVSCAWDADQDSRVGKMLIALSGRMPGYRADITALLEELESHPAVAAVVAVERVTSERPRATDPLSSLSLPTTLSSLGTGLRELSAKWREAAVLEEFEMGNTEYAHALDQCADELDAVLTLVVRPGLETTADEDPRVDTMGTSKDNPAAASTEAIRAAAPELLAALRLLLHEVHESGNASARDFGWPRATDAASAAIAKAEGR